MKYDIAVIGGGPAGMMSAGRAGQMGARVVLLEKNTQFGIKLLMTGKGRCNLTNQNSNLREAINQFGENGKFLFSAFNRFGINDTIAFFNQAGLKTKIERGNRVFPVSDKSADVLATLINYLKKSKVKIKTKATVKKIIRQNNKITKIVLMNNEEVVADQYIICTGGKSYPLTGSTGDGYNWATNLGHTIIKLAPALTPIIIKEKIVKELEGLSLKNVEISIYKNNKKIATKFGEALFTADGMSGPIILDLSRSIYQEDFNNLFLQIDFKPALEFIKLDRRIQRDWQQVNNKMFKNSLNKLLPRKLIPIIIKLSGINPAKKVNLITKEERKKLLHLLKEFKLNIKGLVGYNKAIITKGGIKLSEVSPKTMKSKLIDNLYFAGEILDLDGPTGGYNLQVCWSTGYLAGENAAKN